MPQQNSVDLSDLPKVDLSDLPKSEESPSLFSRVSKWATTPLFGPSEPTMEEWTGPNAGPEMMRRSGWAQATTPLNLVMEAGGGAALLGGALKMRNMMRAGRGGSEISSLGNISPPSVARSVSDIPTGPLSSGIVNLDEEAAKLPGRIVTNINQMPTDTASILQTAPTTFAKPKVRVTAEGQVTSSDITPNAIVRPEFKDTRVLSKKPGSDVRQTEVARYYELADKAKAGTLTGDELVEAQALDKKLRPFPSDTAKASEVDPDVQPPPSRNRMTPPGGMPPNNNPLRFNPDNFNPEDYEIIARVSKHKEPGFIQKVMDSFKAFKATDFPYLSSAALRQANMHVGTKPWLEAWGRASAAYGDEAAADAMEALSLTDPLFRPNYAPRVRANGTPILSKTTGKPILDETPSFSELAGLNRGTKLTQAQVDNIQTGWAEKMPFGWGKHILASNRAYGAFLNHVGDTAFKNMVEDFTALGRDPRKDMPLAKEIAKFVNTSLKRGKMQHIGDADMERSIRLLNNLAWSPRSLQAEATMLNPQNYFSKTPEMRKYYWLANGRRVGLWATTIGLAKLGGAKVSLDPTNSDFGKLRFKNTRVDIPGGMAQFLVLGARIMAQQSTSSVSGQTTRYGSGPFAQTTGSQVRQFMGNKVHPWVDYASDLAFANQRDPIGLFDRTAQNFTPMAIDDIKQMLNEHPYMTPVFELLSSIGLGVQTYGKGGKFNESKFLPRKYDIVLGDGK